MGGGGGGDSETTIRYAPYVEIAHQEFLANVASHVSTAISRNPYGSYDDVPVDVGFFGTGYTMANFPSAYDMYGKFVAGLNIEAIWNELFADTMSSGLVGPVVEAQSVLLQDDLESTALPKFLAGMRDIGAVNSSSFVIGKALLQDTKNKKIDKFAAELKYRLLPIVGERYGTHLKWNSGVIAQYLDLIKYYFTVKQSITEMDYTMKDLYGRWPLEMLDYQRAAMGALQGAMTSKSTGAGPSKGQSALGGALSGAAAGAYMGSVVPGIGTAVGAVAGAVIGGLAGYFM